MKAKLSSVILLLVCLYSTDAAVAPFLTKCKADDSKCLKQSTRDMIPMFAKGIPSLGVESMDPLFIKNLDVSSSSLKLKLEDITAKGFKDCDIKRVHRDKPNSILTLKVLCTVHLDGQYEMKGKILILPIEGKGKAHVVLRKIEISVESLLGEKVGSDGVKHWTIKDWSHTYALKDKATVELDNLFNGNELLSRAARELIASNPNEIVLEVGPPIVKGVVARVVKNVENFFAHIPSKEMDI